MSCTEAATEAAQVVVLRRGVATFGWPWHAVPVSNLDMGGQNPLWTCVYHISHTLSQTRTWRRGIAQGWPNRCWAFGFTRSACPTMAPLNTLNPFA